MSNSDLTSSKLLVIPSDPERSRRGVEESVISKRGTDFSARPLGSVKMTEEGGTDFSTRLRLGRNDIAWDKLNEKQEFGG